MNKIKSFIPHLFTLGNLACGFFAIYFIIEERELEFAGYLVILAGILDFFDGFIARALKVSGELGKQLDSLADMVTFGVVPGFLAWSVSGELTMSTLIFAALIPLFSALRLAKFNIDTRQHDTFIGVPTPMNTFFWVGVVFLIHKYPIFADIITAKNVFIPLTMFSALMLVANIPMLALKFKKLDRAFYLKVFLFLLPSAVALAFMWISALSIIYFYYLACSVIFIFIERNSKS